MARAAKDLEMARFLKMYNLSDDERWLPVGRRPAPREHPPNRACLERQGSGTWQRSSWTRRWWYDNVYDKFTARNKGSCASDRPRPSNYYAFDFARCPLTPLNLSKTCGALAGSNVVFVGDSLHAHFYLAFVMMLSPHLKNSGVLVSTAKTFKPWTVCTDFVPGGVPVMFAREDWLTLSPGHGKEAPPQSLTYHITRKMPESHTHGRWLSRLARNNTLLVLTAGSHVFPHNQQLDHLRRVVAELKKRTATKTPGLRVVHRSTIAGHPFCQNSTRPLVSIDDAIDADARRFVARPREGAALSAPRTRFEKYFWDHINGMRGQVDDVFRQHGFAILDADTPASMRPDAHVGFISKTMRHRPGAYPDCLHFCPSEPLYDVWALTLVTMIQEWGVLE